MDDLERRFNMDDLKHTGRGFPYREFKDYYESECDIQISSIVHPDCIWLGLSNSKPIVMARDAKKAGIETSETVGWVSYPVPKEVQISTRMHLSKDNCIELVKVLNNFIETGEL